MWFSSFDDRRDSPRLLARLFVRGLGGDRLVTDRLGDLSVGGVGFELGHCPRAETYRISFHCPGEQPLRSALARVIDATPLPGTRDRDSPFFVHLRFTDVRVKDQLALARAIERALRVPDYDFEVEEAEHSLLPVARSALPRPAYPPVSPVAPEPRVLRTRTRARPLVAELAPRRAGRLERLWDRLAS